MTGGDSRQFAERAAFASARPHGSLAMAAGRRPWRAGRPTGPALSATGVPQPWCRPRTDEEGPDSRHAANAGGAVAAYDYGWTPCRASGRLDVHRASCISWRRGHRRVGRSRDFVRSQQPADVAEEGQGTIAMNPRQAAQLPWWASDTRVDGQPNAQTATSRPCELRPRLRR